MSSGLGSEGTLFIRKQHYWSTCLVENMSYQVGVLVQKGLLAWVHSFTESDFCFNSKFKNSFAETTYFHWELSLTLLLQEGIFHKEVAFKWKFGFQKSLLNKEMAVQRAPPQGNASTKLCVGSQRTRFMRQVLYQEPFSQGTPLLSCLIFQNWSLLQGTLPTN